MVSALDSGSGGPGSGGPSSSPGLASHPGGIAIHLAASLATWACIKALLTTYKLHVSRKVEALRNLSH